RSPLLLTSYLLLQCHPPHLHLHSLPTRRSSDLLANLAKLYNTRTGSEILYKMRKLRRLAGRGLPVSTGGAIRFLSRHQSTPGDRSEEHTSELQSHLNLVCRLLLDNKNIISNRTK